MKRTLSALLLLALALVLPVPAALASPVTDLTSCNQIVEKVLSQARSGDLAGAKATYSQFRNTWLDIEDGVKDQSKTAYVSIEDEMGTVQFAFAQNPPNQDRVVAAATALRDANLKFINGTFPLDGTKASAPAPAPSPQPAPAPAASAQSAPPVNQAPAPSGTPAPVVTSAPAQPPVPTAAPAPAQATAAAGAPQQNLTTANGIITQAIDQAKKGDVAAAGASFDRFRNTWVDIEDGIRPVSKTAYKVIEEEMGAVQITLAQAPVDQAKLVAALTGLSEANQKFISGGFPVDGGKSAGNSESSVAGLLKLLDEAKERAEAQDAAGAAKLMDQFRNSWLEVEGVVLTQSAKIYGDSEKDMVDAYAFLTANPPQTEKALAVISKMREYLAPIAGKTAYTAFDAATIVLREGLEALLVVVALMGFLRKAGHSDKNIWIWGGVGAGLAVSAAMAVAVKLLFSTAAFGNNNFLIQGWTGLFAAAMLVWVSAWLHSKSSATEWQRYIKEKSTAALATGSLFSLAMLSFLAIFREGTETVLFYVGMASSIAMKDLLIGIGSGLGILVVIAVAILKLGLKIPMRPFFRIASILVFYLGFKFLGNGVHGLQLAGLLPAHMVAWMPTSDFLSLYPNWESTVPQVILLAVAAAQALVTYRRDAALERDLKARTV